MSLISDRVALARTGANDKVICRMASDWAVMGDVQFLPGYCLLLPDPVVPSLNDLDAESRTTYLLEMTRIGNAVLEATGALRMNYEILGNSEPELHCHIFPAMHRNPNSIVKCLFGSMTGKPLPHTQKKFMEICRRKLLNFWLHKAEWLLYLAESNLLLADRYCRSGLGSR
ncbi:HIT domain-containing protein [Pseudomonas lutea]|uniref:HIT domain-containing protein n=1 Tax=Pseudomonas lutea TaxID=243924 RepID=A0A9X8MG23_9PSED|nr:HIT domain-containing protein [Pseudomonas lutea]